MPISEVRIVSIPVSDQERAKEFYVGKLGLQVVRDNPMGEGKRWLEVGPKDASTTIVLVTWFQNMRPGGVTGLVLESDDIDEDCERLRSAGVEVDGPHDMPWGCQAVLADPDGNGIVLAGPVPAGV